LRLAAGICMLSTGLLIGSAGGAIATADTDTSGSAPQSQSVDGAGSALSPASEPAASAATPPRGSTLRNTVTNTLELIGRVGREQAAATRRLLTKAEDAATEKDNAASDLTEEAATPLASVTTEVAPDTAEVAPDTNLAAESATNPLVPVSTVVEPETNAGATVVTVMGTVPDEVAGLPTSPLADVVTSVQEMLTSVIAAVASVPSDLYTMLAGAQAATATIGGGAGYGVGHEAAAAAPLVLPVMPAWPPVLPSSDIWDARGDVAALATAGGVATAGLSEELSISGAAPLATHGITPTGVLPVLDHAVRALLVPVSQLALAALALPGVGGLLIVCAAGIRIGYRQAKATLTLRASGIARFAGSGPLGVVRSGTLIALRPRAVRVARPVASRATGFLDQAA
jgi:hypothetical protein